MAKVKLTMRVDAKWAYRKIYLARPVFVFCRWLENAYILPRGFSENLRDRAISWALKSVKTEVV